MSRYFALVLVPGDTPEDQITETAFEALVPFMQDDDEPDKDFKFDYMIELEDYDAEEVGQFIWKVSDLPLDELEIEAILTPDGDWHEVEDDDEAREVLEQYSDAIGVKYVLHI
jgi:hypothetical protein